MGVSLERVQNKFACIIGELCSEPIILSQFAVWVDLRIAEYKTKGTISLDCSGESPNPGWMKGVKNPIRHGSGAVDTGQAGHRRRGSYTNSPSLQMSPAASPLSSQMYSDRLQSDSGRIQHNSGQQQQNFQTRLSPDIVVIKNEPSPEGPETTTSSCAFGRKRSADGGDLSSDFYSPMKSRRLGGPSSALPSSSAQESSSNQSLMSIINTESDSITLEPVESEADIFKVTLDMQEELRKSQGLAASPSNSTFSPARRPATSAPGSNSSPNHQSWMGSTGGDGSQGSTAQAGFSLLGYGTGTETAEGSRPKHGRPSGGVKVDKMSVGMRKQRIVNREKKSASTIKHQLAALLQIEGWLREPPRSEARNVEEIPPSELDEYLAEFFLCGRKCNGLEFRATYFSRLRTNIERHLKEHGYPYSIVKSPLFVKSQEAFKFRYQSLSYVCTQNPEYVVQVEHVGEDLQEGVGDGLHGRAAAIVGGGVRESGRDLDDTQEDVGDNVEDSDELKNVSDSEQDRVGNVLQEHGQEDIKEQMSESVKDDEIDP